MDGAGRRDRIAAYQPTRRTPVNVLLKPLPYPDASRLAVVSSTSPALRNQSNLPASYPEFVDWRQQNRVFEGLGGSAPVPAVVTSHGEPERVRTARVTGALFRVLRVEPAIGRWLNENDDRPGAPKVAVLAHAFWQRRFGAGPAIVGRTVTVDDTPHVVVGVMPGDFSHQRADLFVPLAMAVNPRTRGSHFLAVRRTRRAADMLVVAEIALSLMLLAGAGLMVKSLVRLEQQDLGVVVERVLAFDVTLPQARYGDPVRARAFYRDALARIRAIPGVLSAGATSGLPLYGYGNNSYVTAVQGRLVTREQEPLAETRVVTGDYFKALGVPLLRGRLFDERDTADSKNVIVINRAMAEAFWPNQDPIGKWIHQWRGDKPLEVVGVVGSVRSYSPALEPALEVSYPFSQFSQGAMTIVLRATGDARALLAAVRAAIGAIDSSQPISNVQTMEEVVRTSLARPRTFSVLTSAFAALAGLLAVIGVYSLIAYAVSQRTREFGVRMAMGADGAAVLRLVLGRGMKLALAGTALGAPAALAATRLLRSMLFGVAPDDPLVFVLAGAAMLAAAAAACLVPALAAARVDPAAALRA